MVAVTRGEISVKAAGELGGGMSAVGLGLAAWMQGETVSFQVGMSLSLLSDLGAKLSCQPCFHGEDLEQASLAGLPGVWMEPKQ